MYPDTYPDLYEVAFLRGINVGGHRVTNTRLRELFESAGATAVTTFQAAGNVVFEPGSADRASIESALAQGLGYEAAAYIRTATELHEVARGGPFAHANLPAGASLLVTFLHEPPSAAVKRAVAAESTDEDDVRVAGRQLYWLARRKFSGSTVDMKAIARVLGDPGTNRNITTVRRIVAKFG
jgi:uncharacterized protein (DUF1697 family)